MAIEKLVVHPSEFKTRYGAAIYWLVMLAAGGTWLYWAAEALLAWPTGDPIRRQSSTFFLLTTTTVVILLYLAARSDGNGP